jgi:hypothetical protein
VRRQAKLLLLAIFCALLPAFVCAGQSPPPPNSVYGAYPSNYKEIITAWLNTNLTDPRSAQINWLGEPHPGELNVSKSQVVSGFLVDFSVNARNIFGAYTGAQKHTALLRDGQVVTATGFVYH